MEKSRQIKERKVGKFREDFSESRSVVFADYKGLTVEQMETLRRNLREVGANMRVIKNTLARVGLHELGIQDLDDDLDGQVAFVFSKTDAVVGTKAAFDFSRKNEKFKILGGYFDGRKLGLEQVKELASLASREELQARLVGTLSAPLMKIASILSAPLQELVGTLQARVSKLEKNPE
ncbi:MAG TPA: 50S ribosomal protein L10 [Firmicutes bacterium]|nr:50S ribosomal protein L10 [Bacillota bacterium]